MEEKSSKNSIISKVDTIKTVFGFLDSCVRIVELFDSKTNSIIFLKQGFVVYLAFVVYLLLICCCIYPNLRESGCWS